MKAGKRYMMLDLAKRTLEVCVVKDGQSAIERASGMKTDGKGRARLARLLTTTDVAGMEAMAYMPMATSSCWRGIRKKRLAAWSMYSTPVSCVGLKSADRAVNEEDGPRRRFEESEVYTAAS